MKKIKKRKHKRSSASKISVAFLALFTAIALGVAIMAIRLTKKASCGNVLFKLDGYYTIYPDDITSIRAYCSFKGGKSWTIINPKLDEKWLTYLSPNQYSDKEKGSLTPNSCISWREWFKLSKPQTQFATSDDCKTITKAGYVYRATGNFYGCLWWAGNDPTNAYYNGPYNFFRMETQDKRYVDGAGKCWNCNSDWWNTAPSIGADNTHCVAYSEK